METSKLHNNRGSALIMRGQLEAARTELEAAIRVDPGNFSAITNLGYVLDCQVRMMTICATRCWNG